HVRAVHCRERRRAAVLASAGGAAADCRRGDECRTGDGHRGRQRQGRYGVDRSRTVRDRDRRAAVGRVDGHRSDSARHRRRSDRLRDPAGARRGSAGRGSAATVASRGRHPLFLSAARPRHLNRRRGHVRGRAVGAPARILRGARRDRAAGHRSHETRRLRDHHRRDARGSGGARLQRRRGDSHPDDVMLQLFSIYHLNLAYSSIEEAQRPDVVRRCYWPLLRLGERSGAPIGIEASGFTLERAAEADPSWLAALRALVERGRCEFVGSGYAQLIGPLVPAPVNAANLRLGHAVYERLLGFRPRLAFVNEQAYAAGLIQHYLDAGYAAIVMEWDNPARAHPEWSAELRYFPQIAAGQDGESIPLIWNKAIAFQQFQRYAHGESSLDDYLGYLAGHVAVAPRALAMYGNDAEIFDFRPGRYRTESAIDAGGEWDRIEQLYAALA